MYRAAKGNMPIALNGCAHYEQLIDAGFREDVSYCLQEDLYSVVPVFREGIITK